MDQNTFFERQWNRGIDNEAIRVKDLFANLIRESIEINNR